ncbi:MAG: DNA repair protein RecN [Betaproteobacteria bacterium]|nr:DNA repair protein RecN [Betaproteobacteria bacterium]
MLRSLTIRDFVIVDSVELELASGFTVLTGETGAGKSILVDALELLVGGRAESGVVREAAERAELAAEFDVGPTGPLAAYLEQCELAGDPGVLLLRRVIDRSGRSRAFVNGRAATLAQVKEVGEYLVDIHGQHAHQSLLRPPAQRALLDGHAGVEDLARETAEAWRTWKRLQALASEAFERHAQREAERAELQDKVSELKRLGPAEGEWEMLATEHARLANGAALVAGAESSLEALSQAEGSTLAQLTAVAARLRSLMAHDAALEPIVELLASAEAQVGEAARELRHYASKIELDPQAVHSVEVRLETLHAAGRKYRVKPAELAQYAKDAKVRLAELELAADTVALQKQVEVAKAAFLINATKLSDKRRTAASVLSKSVTAGMQALAMAGGRFAVQLNPLEEPAAHGLEDVEFEVASHPSLPLRALGKVASGGELSRISLALQMVASKSSPVATLVFDEVDSGIGGAVAEMVGRSLRALGLERQVLAVTHLPQVAAQGDTQWTVAKGGGKGRLRTSVTQLDRAGRVDELARMLGGTEITPTTRKHASELLGE